MGELTSEEMAQLRVRLADLPGFNPVGLTVDAKNGDGSTFGAALCVGVRHPQGGTVFWMWTEVNGVFGHGTEVFVSTADTRTRDALARWVAGRVGLTLGCTAPRWVVDEDWRQPRRWVLTVNNRDGYVCFDNGSGDLSRQGGPPRAVGVRALADLDVGDDRLLPDGSRWVDAAALAAVCGWCVSVKEGAAGDGA